MSAEHLPKALTEKEKGILADKLIEFSLVPNRRVILEGAEQFDYRARNVNGSFHRRLEIVSEVQKGQLRTLRATSQWTGGGIVKGELEFMGEDSPEDLEKAAHDFINSLLKSLR